jgi:AAA domain
VSRQRRWEVDREAIGLGFFTFSKFMMWRDVEGNAWPNGMLLDHGLLNVLLGEDTGFETYPPLAADDEPIDEKIDITKSIHVVDTDSSQAVVIEEAGVGRNLVVQGPPGTGKSQTITNIIAGAAHSGKTVLFVAEKTAALDVVYDRLKKAGLGAICLEMHSRKANKREVVKSLDEALRLSSAARFDAGISSRLGPCRDQLNVWAQLMHRPIGQTRRSPFHVIGSQLNLRANNIPLLNQRLDSAADWTADKLASADKAAKDASGAIAKLGVVPNKHPWFGTNIALQSPFDIERLTLKLRVALDNVSLLPAQLARVFSHVGVGSEPTIEDAFATARSFRHVAAAPASSRSALADPQ